MNYFYLLLKVSLAGDDGQPAQYISPYLWRSQSVGRHSQCQSSVMFLSLPLSTTNFAINFHVNRIFTVEKRNEKTTLNNDQLYARYICLNFFTLTMVVLGLLNH